MNKAFLKGLHRQLSIYEDYTAMQTKPPNYKGDKVKKIQSVVIMIEKDDRDLKSN